MSADAEKRSAARTAALHVESGMRLGLGTGSTTAHFLDALAERCRDEGLQCVGVPTSRATEAQAHRLGLPLTTLDACPELDLTVDGADQIGPGLSLIKGGGAALLREKLVWEASARRIVIADSAKRVDQLGAFPLPVEVVAFGHLTTAARIGQVLHDLGYATAPALRLGKDGEAVRTDSGHLIYDLALLAITDEHLLAQSLKAITGVVDHGLFLGLADLALIGTPSGVETRSA